MLGLTRNLPLILFKLIKFPYIYFIILTTTGVNMNILSKFSNDCLFIAAFY
jgi:hypothetical protein